MLSLPQQLTRGKHKGQPRQDAPPDGESLLYNFGISNRTLTGSSGPQPGFTIGTVGANGALHKHLNGFLQGSNGTSDPATGADPVNQAVVTLAQSRANTAYTEMSTAYGKAVTAYRQVAEKSSSDPTAWLQLAQAAEQARLETAEPESTAPIPASPMAAMDNLATGPLTMLVAAAAGFARQGRLR